MTVVFLLLLFFFFCQISITKLTNTLHGRATLSEHAFWAGMSDIFQAMAAQGKPKSDCPGLVKFALGQIKIDVWWPSGQEKSTSVCASENRSSLAHWASRFYFFPALQWKN